GGFTSLRIGFGPGTGSPASTGGGQGGLGAGPRSGQGIQILSECGFLPTGPVGLVNLGQIPDGLNAEELERFLRKHGAEIRGFRGTQVHGEPAGASLSAAP